MPSNKSDNHTILVIDDEENLCFMLKAMLTRQGYSVDTACNGMEGLKLLKKQLYDFILCDIRMPEMDGKQFLLQSVEEHINSPIIMMSAYGSVDTAIECMQKGAYDFISKPFKKDEIVMVLKKAEERERLKSENISLRSTLAARDSFAGILSRNSAMQTIFSQIQRVADLKTTILILGESGTGKELVARALHTTGKRVQKPFIAVNCGAIPENLLESELFGHVKGAFTDASTDKTGLFEQADGGTLFLDEIGEMPLPLQVKLLRVLQEEEIRRVGASISRKINVRVVSATSKNLESEVKNGKFREDLYFRLNVFCITIPPLRERLDDIQMLAEFFIRKHSATNPNKVTRISPDAIRILIAYSWPGNVRELENVIERGMILCDDTVIVPSCFPPALTPANLLPTIANSDEDEELSIKKAENAIERDLIRKALFRTGGNRTHAARILEISHRSLLYKMKEYAIE